MNGQASDAGDVADLLQEWKRRSGRTYEALARRSRLSRSSVHRYCHGLSLPESFAPLEALGDACGADRQEIATLFRLWSAGREWRLQTSSAEPCPPAEPDVAEPEAAEPEAAKPDVAEPNIAQPPRESAFKWWRTVLALLAVIGAIAYLGVQRFGPAAVGGRSTGFAAADQRVLGPTWVSNPRTVPPGFFGVTMNSTTGAMPGFRVGAVRLWDSGTSWSALEPSRGAFRLSTLERLVNGAGKAGRQVLFTLGATPGWAAAAGPRTPYPDGSRSAPPDDLEDWDHFVREISTGYAGRIQAYELWVLAPSSLYYSGSVETLVAMTERAARIIRAADPKATIVCPSMGELWQPQSREFLTRFAALGGYQHCDVAGVKLHPRDFGQAPESILELTTMIDKTFHDAGVRLPLWSTGTTYSIATATPLDEVKARNYAVRLFLISLYARYDRMYFYNWGGRKIPIVLQAEGGPPTTAARYVERLQEWLLTAQIYSCGHGPDDGLPAQVWRCRFTVDVGPNRAPAQAQIVWTSSGTATVIAPGDGVSRRLDGSVVPLRRGVRHEVGEEPAFEKFTA